MKHGADLPGDLELIQKVIDGDVNTFEKLIEKYKGDVVKIVKNHVPYDNVEEVAHDVFLRAYQALPTYKANSDFKNWLSVISVRTSYDYWRKIYRSKEIPVSSLSEDNVNWIESVLADETVSAPDANIERTETTKILQWAMNKMSAEERMVIELVHLEGRSGKEAAALLGWSVANVKIRAYRARKKLHKLLKKVYEV